MSNVAINKIRTGNGDSGDTKLGGKTYRKGHAIVQCSAALDLAQSLSYSVPKKWNDFYPRVILQELLFRIGAAIGGRKPKEQELAIQEIGALMASQIEHISGGLEPLDSFIRCNEINYQLYDLRARIRDAEAKCVAARDQIEYEAKSTSPNLLYMLERSMVALNIASDWVFAFMWVIMVNDNGKLDLSDKWLPFTNEKIIKLNS